MASKGTILILSQVYVPDSAAVGQHMHEAAIALVQRGFRVVVLTSSRGYDDPSIKNPRRELRDGVDIRRLPLSSFGKGSLTRRLTGAAFFLTQALLRAFCVRGLRGVLVSTSPPMCSGVAWLLATIRRTPYTFWVMDINPDQAVILGQIQEGSLLVRLFNIINRQVLKRAKRVVTLDPLMADRMNRKFDATHKTVVIPAWTMLEPKTPAPHSENPFRKKHQLDGRLVFMYSGNHSVAHPISTILDAAKRLEDREDIVFMFVGGGLGKRDVDIAVQNGAKNIRSLPYQALEELQWSLSAADIHLVTFSQEMVGVVHPCKAYGALAVGRPILLVGPTQSHIGNLIDDYHVGWAIEKDAVDEMVQLVQSIAAGQAGDLEAMGRRGVQAIRESLSPTVLRGRLCDVIEDSLVQ